MSELNLPAAKSRAITPHTILDERLMELQQKMTDARVDANLMELVQDCRNLVSPLEDYLVTHTSQPSEALVNLEKQTNDLDWDTAYKTGETELQLEKEMLSGGVEGQFLQLLISISQAKDVLEIGSFTGYATLAMAEALPQDGKVIACEYDAFTAEFAKSQWSYSSYGDKIEVRVGDALKTLKTLANEDYQFDLVFIDADKTSYHSYYSLLFDLNLIKKGGLICVDNTLYMGEVYSPSKVTDNGTAIRSFNSMVANDNRVQQVLLPLRDGITVIRHLE